MAYTERARYQAHDSLTTRNIEMITKGYRQINRNLDIIQAFADIPGQKKRRDGKCLTKKLNGTNKLKVKSSSTMDSLAKERRNKLTFHANYLAACYNSWSKAAPKSATRDCIVTELAGIIVHEACHACWGNERYAYLLDYYYRWCMRTRLPATSGTCIAVNRPKSWLPQDYKNEDDVLKHVCRVAHTKDGGVWVLTRISGTCP